MIEGREKEDPSSLWLVAGGSAILACAGAFFFALAAATGMLATQAQVVDTHSALDYAFVGAATGAFMGIGFILETNMCVGFVCGGRYCSWSGGPLLQGCFTNDIKMWAASSHSRCCALRRGIDRRRRSDRAHINLLDQRERHQMRALICGGTFDKTAGKASKIMAQLAEATGWPVLNGGTIAQLEAVEVEKLDVIAFMPNIDNAETKLLPQLKVRNPKLLLVSTKRVVEKSYSDFDVISRLLKTKSNLGIKFTAFGDRYEMKLLTRWETAFARRRRSLNWRRRSRAGSQRFAP